MGSFGVFHPINNVNVFAANNVVQQKGSFRRRLGVMGVDSVGEV